MDDFMDSGYPRAPEVADVVDGIVELVRPSRIYLYNQRVSLKGATTAFKLCVVGNFADKAETERSIYLGIDSEVPFDILLYTPVEWEGLCDHVDSFARKISLTGMIVYG